MKSELDEFYRLVGRVLDGGCSDDQREELAQFILEYPQFEEIACECFFVNSLLEWRSKGSASRIVDLELNDDVLLDGIELTQPRAKRGEPRPMRQFLAAAAVLLGVSLITWTLLQVTSKGRSESLAEIIEQSGVDWTAETTALRTSGTVGAGLLRSSKGSYTLQFRSGPTVHVVGPSSFQVKSDMLVSLHQGQATVHVTEASRGFTLTTPLANVVDQGTQFGVAVGDQGRTDVVVFEGMVDLERTRGTGNRNQRLVQGEALSINSLGAVDQLKQVMRDARGGWWTNPDANRPVSVFDEVRHSLPQNIEVSKYHCYQITYRGLDDDAPAYADHPHEWNGLTSDGLPAFLRGADYVRTFNDYRYRLDFKMTIKLARPATLYIFSDDRIPPPLWLKDQFEKTGVRIGLDEGKHQDCPDHESAVGGGQSIDTVFSVWRRRCVDTTPINLGNPGEWGSEGANGRAMYGIAATPLESAPETTAHPASEAGVHE